MSNLLLDFLNQEIQLSKQITNIEKEFSTGYYYAELFKKIGCLKSDINEYKIEPNTLEEIKNNFEKLKPEFSNIGIHIDDEIINLIINKEKNIASNFIYKIKTKLDRKNINFEEIMNKMKMSYKKLEEMKNKKEKFIKTSTNFLKRKSNFLNKSKSTSNLTDLPLLKNNITNKLNSKLKIKPFKQNNKIFFSLKNEENKNNNINLNITSKKTRNIKEITEEVTQNENNENYNNIKTRNKIEKIKKTENEITTVKNTNNKYENKTMNEFINFTSLENNSFKIGLNMLDIKPKLNKFFLINTNNTNNTNLIKTDILKEKLKEKLNEYKKEKKDRTTHKEKELNEALKNSTLKNIEKSFKLNKSTNQQFLRMTQYEKLRKKKFPLKTKQQIEEIKKNKIFRSTFNIINDTNYEITTDKNWYKTCYMNFGKLKKNLSFGHKEYIKSLKKEEIMETKIKNEIKRKKMEDDVFDIEDIVNLIIDISEQAYNYQNKTKKEFINLPEYQNWVELFIEGKSCIKNNDAINMKIIVDTDEEDDNKKEKKRRKTNSENKLEIKREKMKNEIMNSEYCSNEYMDYIYNRGYWNNELYIPNNYYGTQLHIYQVLGEDLIKTISSAKVLFQGMMQINFNKMKNEEFELKEEEKENILVPSTNKRNELFGEIIELNYDNNISEIQENDDNILTKDLSYIPIKLCLIGTTFSGRRTQAELIREKYPEIKIYSIKDIINFYLKEYERLYINVENKENKENKNNKKRKEEKELELEKKNFEKIKELIENYALKKENDLSDETKIKLLLNEIEKNFPHKNEKEVIDDLNKIKKRKEEIEKELEEINNDENKKNKNKAKEEKLINKLKTELDELNNKNYTGFILIDFPNNIHQHKMLEEYLSGFVQEIEKYPNKRDINLNLLTDDLDKPYNNISHLSKENNNFSKSAFNKYILLNANEEIIINHVNVKLEEINEKKEALNKKKEKKLEEVDWDEPDMEKIKEDMERYNEEISKIFDFLGNFKNLEIINEKEKNDMNKIIENEIINSVKLFEDKININNKNDSSNGNNKYLKRLKEVKIIIKKDTSKNIIKNWKEIKNKYMLNTKEFIYNIYKLKEEIIKKMNLIQNDFIRFLNEKSEKKKIINLFLNKYNVFIENFSSIKNNSLVKEESERDIIELTENLWGIIQLRKKKAIDELNNIKNKHFMRQKIEYFSEMISNLFYSEAEYYLDKINIIQQFYNQFENKTNRKFEYKLKKSELMKNTNNLEIYMPPPSEKEIIKEEKIKPRIKRYEEVKKEYLISPKIDKIYKNCYKLLFNYDKKLKEEGYKPYKREMFFSFKRKKTKRFDFKRESNNNLDNKIINTEFELKNSLDNEKIKYKLRIALLKFFGEKFLEKLYNIEKITFENMDKWIAQSVDAQNNAMNFIINKIKENILKPSFLEINNVILDEELDVFNIYEKVYHNFDEYNLKNYNLIKKEDKEFDLNELYKIYLDLKSFEIQDNYVTLDSLIDILFKKYIFNFNSKGLMKCFKELPYKYIHKFILKFVIKTNKEQNLIRIDRLFTILALMNENIPDTEEISKMIKRTKNLVKYNNYLSKDDFLKIKFWFDFYEKNEEKKESKIIKNNIKNKIRRISYFNNVNKMSSFLINEKTKNKRINSPFEIDETPIKKNMSYKREKTKDYNEISPNESSFDFSRDNKKNLKEILYLINKNYKDDINIFEFFDNICLKFITKLKRKSTLKIKRKENEKDFKNNINQRQTYYEKLILY